MFGIGIFELLVILIVAIIALGPNKLPQTIIDIVKFFRAVRKTMAEAKESFDKEIELSEIKQEALKYKNTISNEVDKLTQDMKLDELRELNINDLSDSLKPLQESLTDTKKELDKEANALRSTLKNLNTEISYESPDFKSEDSKNAESIHAQMDCHIDKSAHNDGNANLRLRHDLKRVKIKSRETQIYESVVGVGDTQGGGSDFAIQAPPPCEKETKTQNLSMDCHADFQSDHNDRVVESSQDSNPQHIG